MALMKEETHSEDRNGNNTKHDDDDDLVIGDSSLIHIQTYRPLMVQQNTSQRKHHHGITIRHMLIVLIGLSAFSSLRLLTLQTQADGAGNGYMGVNSLSGMLNGERSASVSDRSNGAHQDTVHRNDLELAHRRFNSTIHLVVFLGLEGTGHHLMQQLVNGSNTLQDLISTNIHPSLTDRMYKLLFRSVKTGDPQMALWSAPCRRALSGRWMENIKDPNITRISERLVSVLRSMESRANDGGWRAVHDNDNRQNRKQKQKQLTIPVNTLFDTPSSGLLSYPSFLGPCRPITYPNLNVWYDVCDQANVDCSHVYMYRNPYEIIKSTSIKRHLNQDALDGIHVYITLLYVLYGQLSQHGSKTLACINFFDANTKTPKLDELLFDFGNNSFEHYLESVFHAPAPFDWSKREDIVPKEYDLYMKSMIQIHDQVVALCHRQVGGRRH